MKKFFIFIFVFVYSYVCGMQHNNLYYNSKTDVLKKYYTDYRENYHKKCNCFFISDYVCSDIEFCSQCLQIKNLYPEEQDNKNTYGKDKDANTQNKTTDCQCCPKYLNNLQLLSKSKHEQDNKNMCDKDENIIEQKRTGVFQFIVDEFDLLHECDELDVL